MAAEAAIDHETHAIDGERAFSDGRGENDATINAAAARPEGLGLGGQGLLAMEAADLPIKE